MTLSLIHRLSAFEFAGSEVAAKQTSTTFSCRSVYLKSSYLWFKFKLVYSYLDITDALYVHTVYKLKSVMCMHM